MVDSLVIWLSSLAGRIVHIISMRDIYLNFLCNRWFSRLAKVLDCKDYNFPYYLSFLTLGQRVAVIKCLEVIFTYLLLNAQCVLVFRTSINFLCSRRFSRLAKIFGWKDCCCPYYQYEGYLS